MLRLTSQLNKAKCPPELINLILSLSVACKEISFRLQQGSVDGLLGSAGNENVQGEEQKKLDVISNEVIKTYLQDCGVVRALASEEEEDIVPCSPDGRYLVAFDPLDGSSNIDINSLVGTIFSIYQAPQGKADISAQDFLIPGRQQVAAGYVLYGPSVMLVLSTGQGVKMFTLDHRIGVFILARDNVRISVNTREFAINMSNQRHWAEPMQHYVRDLLAGSEGPRGKNFNMRWVAAMVGDIHRLLSRGGIFSYPWDRREPDKAGKLRLLYEANPMGFLVEQAGGRACTESADILDLQPQHIHQRVPVIMGSTQEVETCLRYHEHD